MTFLSAVLLGLLASAHCAGMCGGLQSALQQPMVLRSTRQARLHLLALNFGRLSIYIAAGVLFSVLGTSIVGLADIPQITRLARNFSAIVLLLIGIQLLLLNSKPFIGLEKMGAGLWQHASQGLSGLTGSSIYQTYLRGLVWGFLPCGLIYGVLMTTLFAQNVVQGGLIMLGFGVGTLPAMILTGNFYLQLRRAVNYRGVQLVGGLVFIFGGLLMISAPWFISMDFMLAYPQLMSGLFCIS